MTTALARWTRARRHAWSRSIIEPFYETARLLYEGPWVAERYLVIRDRCWRRRRTRSIR